MRRRNELVFDEVINATSLTPAFTSDKYDAILGQFDQLAIFVLIDEVSASNAGFSLYIDHSADGRQWIQGKNNSPDVQITVGNLSTTATNVAWGSDPGTLVNPPTPLLGFVRLRMYFFNVAVTAHVKVYVTQRDQGG
jgi:hypothetical protein